MSLLSMTKTLIKSVIHGPYTTLYPWKEKEFFDLTRGRIEIEIQNCIFCGQCARRCPTGAIQVSKPEALWSIERMQCIQCNYCSEVCPKKCLNMNHHYSEVSQECVKDEYRNA